MPLYIEPRGSSVEQDRTPARRGPHCCAKVGYSSERLCAVDFGASCGSALAVVPAPVLGELRLSNVFLRAVYCAAGCGGAFPRRRPFVTAALLVIGSKILSGRTKDQNVGYIAEYLTAVGIDLKEVRVVGNEETVIVDALNELRRRCTYVFTTGGIGPTHGHITADCVAKAFGVPMDRDPRALAILHEWVKTTGAEMSEARPAHDAHPQGRGSHPQQGV